MALLEATSLHARPVVAEGPRVNARNTPAPSGDLYQTGRGLLAAGDVAGAMAAFRQALLEAPQSVDALNGLAVCYDRLGRYDISRGYYDSALALEPGSALVLNNLGYSLYLQGQYEAAIPVLQRAAAARDPAVVAASRRVLAMVAADMRDKATHASAGQALAEVEAPGAHIETATNGEQRLVLDAPAPSRALVAALGDRAGLVSVARSTTAPLTTTARIADSIAPPIRVQAADADSGALPTIVYLTTSQPGQARTVTVAMPADEDAPGTIIAAHAPASRPIAPAPAMATPAIARTITADAAPLQRRRVPAPGPGRDEPAPAIVPMGGTSGDHRRDAIPAWLLSSRRSDRPSFGRAETGQGPHNDGAVVAFESDLVELNRFASRMRGIEVPLPADPDADRDTAVARLEQLITRIRSA